MIKRLTVGLAIVGFATALGGTASAATARPAPSDWSMTQSSLDGCDMTYDCNAPLSHDVWDW